MSTDRDTTRIVRSWLRADEHESVDRVLAAVLDQLDTTPQRRATWWPARRLPPMSTQFRYGIAAAVVVGAAVVSFSLLANQVGTPSTPTPSAFASGSAPPSGGLIPAELQHPFLGATREVAVSAGGDRSILDFTENRFELATGPSTIFLSDASVVGPDVLVLVSGNVTAGGCQPGDEGRYGFALSPGGSILTIAEGTDDCAARAATLPGGWQRSDCRNPENVCLGNLEAGTYSSQFIEPRPQGEWAARYGALTYSVPDGWAAASDFPETYALMRQADYAAYDPEACSECADQIVVWVNPLAAAMDCSEAAVPEVGGSVDELVAWLQRHPGLVVSEPQSTAIGGLNGTIVDLEMAEDWTGTCDAAEPFVAAPIFFNGYHLAIAAGDRQRFILLDLGDGDTLALNIDSRETADFDAFASEAMSIVETFEFPAR
jgi:hypothetical protein